MTPLAEWTNEELAAAMSGARADLFAATKKKLEADIGQGRASARILEIESELRVRRLMFRRNYTHDDFDHEQFIEENSIGGKTYKERYDNEYR